MCGRGLVLRKWPLLGLDEIHLACSHERARKSQGCESSHLPPGLLVHPFSEHNSHLFRVGGSAPFTPFHWTQHHLQLCWKHSVLRTCFYSGSESGCSQRGPWPCYTRGVLSHFPAGPHFFHNFLPDNSQGSPRMVGCLLRLGPEPLTFMSASSCIPSLGLWHPMARLQKVRRLGTIPFFARIGNSACRTDKQLLPVTHKPWPDVLVSPFAGC